MQPVVGDISIGVSLLNYNGSTDTSKCVESLLHNAEDPLLITILENGSAEVEKDQLNTDLSKFEEKLSFKIGSKISELDITVYDTDSESMIVCIESDYNVGFCTGNNLVVEFLGVAGAKDALVMNNDAVIESGAINRLSRTLSASPDIAAVSPKIIEPEKEIWYAGGSYSSSGYTYIHELEKENDYYRTNVHSGCCVLFDIDVYDSMNGMFDPLFICLDEPEIARRLIEHGYDICVEPRAEVVHTPHQTIESNGRKYIDYFFARNTFIYSSIFNSRLRNLTFQAEKFIEFAKPIFQSVGENATGRAETGTEVVFDYYLGRYGPGSLWNELNSFHYENDLWDPESEWNAEIRQMHSNI